MGSTLQPNPLLTVPFITPTAICYHMCVHLLTFIDCPFPPLVGKLHEFRQTSSPNLYLVPRLVPDTCRHSEVISCMHAWMNKEWLHLSPACLGTILSLWGDFVMIYNVFISLFCLKGKPDFPHFQNPGGPSNIGNDWCGTDLLGGFQVCNVSQNITNEHYWRYWMLIALQSKESQSYQVGTTIITILQMGKLRQRITFQNS